MAIFIIPNLAIIGIIYNGMMGKLEIEILSIFAFFIIPNLIVFGLVMAWWVI